jgi:hypothetical protein
MRGKGTGRRRRTGWPRCNSTLRCCGCADMSLPKPYMDKFLAGFIPVPECGCWIWIGSSTNGGYGTMSIKNKNVYVHRISWEIHRGQIPRGMCVLHRCDVRPCMNPDHLFLGTRPDNSSDMARKNRSTQGSRNPMAKLTEEKAKIIRSASGKSNYKIAAAFNVCDETIRRIRNGTGWKHC